MSAAPAAARTARYAAAGALCALAHNAIMILGDLAGGHYVPMTLVSFGLVTPFGYWLHTRFTFREPASPRAFLRFASGVAAGFPLSFASMALFVSGLGLPVPVAAPLATLTLFAWNYASAHWAIAGRFRFR